MPRGHHLNPVFLDSYAAAIKDDSILLQPSVGISEERKAAMEAWY
jgi:hypothetical protein